MKAMDYDRLATSAPLNRTAGAVTTESRDTYTPNISIARRHSSSPLPTHAPSRNMLVCPSFEDLTGRAFGRFTVIGLLDAPPEEKSSKKPRQWVVRCACGDYETRTARAIRNPNNAHDACDYCLHLQNLRNRETAKARGFVAETTVEEAVERIKGRTTHG